MRAKAAWSSKSTPAPACGCTWSPPSGKPRPVGEAIVESLFPRATNGRIPIVAVTGVNGKTTTTRFIAHILRSLGKKVGMTCTDGIFIDDRRIEAGDCSGPQSAQAVLMNPVVDAAVLETARGGILREGLGFDRCDVAVVTNIGEGDHLGLSDIETVEELAKVKRTHRRRGVAQTARPCSTPTIRWWRRWPADCPARRSFSSPSAATIR